MIYVKYALWKENKNLLKQNVVILYVTNAYQSLLNQANINYAQYVDKKTGMKTFQKKN